MTTTTSEVRVGEDVFIIPCGEGFTCLGFDVCIDRIERIAIELTGRAFHTIAQEKALVKRAHQTRGTLNCYDIYTTALRSLKAVCDADGDRAVYELNPQLIGLEGCRVEVVDKRGERRRFIVGKSTGWAPCHLEIKRRDSSGGEPADLEYEAVRVIERVR